MEHLRKIVATGLLCLSLAVPMSAQASDWSVTLFSGAVYNAKADLRLKQKSNPDIVISNASLKTKPLTSPPYYGIRVAKTIEGGAWEFEHIHHKLYLDKLPANLQKFEITDGYNLFFINRSWTRPRGIEYRVGIGAVISHPDITIYNKSNFVRGGGAIPIPKIWTDGYRCCGVAIQVAYSKSFPITDKWDIVPEVKLTHSVSDVPISDGSVQINNTAVHFNLGIKYKFQGH